MCLVINELEIIFQHYLKYDYISYRGSKRDVNWMGYLVCFTKCTIWVLSSLFRVPNAVENFARQSISWTKYFNRMSDFLLKINVETQEKCILSVYKLQNFGSVTFKCTPAHKWPHENINKNTYRLFQLNHHEWNKDRTKLRLNPFIWSTFYMINSCHNVHEHQVGN